jgi:hypothetical protein
MKAVAQQWRLLANQIETIEGIRCALANARKPGLVGIGRRAVAELPLHRQRREIFRYTVEEVGTSAQRGGGRPDKRAPWLAEELFRC